VTGPDYQVSPASLGDVAAGIETVVSGLAGGGVAALGPVPGDVGHAGLSATFLLFCDRWEWGVRAAVRTCDDLVEELRAAGDAYRRAEGDGEDLLARIAYDVVGDPSAVGGTWADVFSATLPDREMPDWGELGGQWTNTTEDLAEHAWPSLIARVLAGENPFAEQLDDLRPIAE
jgi:hypothetical protein